MDRTVLITALVFLSQPILAQQAGDAASTDTEGTYQSLVDACDDVDALMLRARIRLQIPRATVEAAGEAEEMLEQGFATCASGDIEGAKAQLAEALSIAEAGAAERFSAEDTAVQKVSDTAPKEAVTTSDKGGNEADATEKPWWKFW